MDKIFGYACFQLGVVGILGFFATLIVGCICCCTPLSQTVFFTFLMVFALIGFVISVIRILHKLKQLNE